MSELYHYNPYHDRKTGRFTDKNGNITETGLQRYKELLRDRSNAAQFYDNAVVNLEKTKAGVFQRDGEDYIKKGSTFTRFTDKEETLDSSRKYVSVTEEDRKRYGEVAKEGFLGTKDVNNILEVQYTAKKDLHVAQGHAVVDYLLDEYGDTKITDVSKRALLSKDDKKVIKTALDAAFGGDDIKAMQRDINNTDLVFDLDPKKYKDEDRKVIDAIQQYASTREKIMTAFYSSKLMTEPMENNPTFDHFAKLGYDAIVDVEDAEWVNYPLILINPSRSVRKKKVAHHDSTSKIYTVS